MSAKLSGRLQRSERGQRLRDIRRIGVILAEDDSGFVSALRAQLERRRACPPPAIDPKAIGAEIDDAIKEAEFDLDGCHHVQAWYVGDGNESARIVVEIENPQTEELHRLVERAVVGRIGMARALAINAAVLAESFGGRYADFEEV